MKKDNVLTQRQQQILEIIGEYGELSAPELVDKINQITRQALSQITLD